MPRPHAPQVTDQYLRLYSAANVMAGDRTVAAKRHVAPGQQLVYARPVAAGGGAAPGVMALAAAEHGLSVQVGAGGPGRGGTWRLLFLLSPAPWSSPSSSSLTSHRQRLTTGSHASCLLFLTQA